ncbi:MAG: cation:proton antiporter [Clostridia bacterium]|nr:cation:proton antiporter [Clostridia bacterium]
MLDLIWIATALFAGLLMSRFAKLLKLPAVTGYLVAGILIGPFCLGALGIEGLGFNTGEQVKSLSVICNVALGFIAFAIGNEFRLSQLKRTGKQAVVVAILESLTATVLVDAVMMLMYIAFGGRLTVPTVLLFGAIAAATAPAATLMVVRQYKAKGPVTSILLPVVALDDATGLMIFAVSFGIAKAIISGGVDVISIVIEPIIEIIASLLLGSLMGALMTFAERFFHSRSKRMSLSIAFVLMTVVLSMQQFKLFGVNIGFSSLLVCMMLGTVFCNMCDFSEELMERCDRWTAPLFILFFVLSGAELDLSVFSDMNVVLIGAVYIVVRALGKYIGAGVGSRLMKCEPQVQKYLGITLFPQAGVALGMSLTASSLGAEGALVRNIVLFGVLIYELFGPVLTKIALTKAGDITPDATSARRKKIEAQL